MKLNSPQKQIKLLLTFFRNHFLANMVMTGLCLWVLISNGLIAFEACFWLKIISYGIIYYFVDNLRKSQYYYYQNLGVKKNALWATTLSIDFVLYILLIVLTYQLKWIPQVIH